MKIKKKVFYSILVVVVLIVGSFSNLHVSAVTTSGIRNLGNSCYINAVIQALHANSKFVEFVRFLSELQKNDPNDVKLAYTLNEVFTALSEKNDLKSQESAKRLESWWSVVDFSYRSRQERGNFAEDLAERIIGRLKAEFNEISDLGFPVLINWEKYDLDQAFQNFTEENFRRLSSAAVEDSYRLPDVIVVPCQGRGADQYIPETLQFRNNAYGLSSIFITYRDFSHCVALVPDVGGEGWTCLDDASQIRKSHEEYKKILDGAVTVTALYERDSTE